MAKSIVARVISSVFGTKSEKDQKALQPIVAKVNEEWPRLKAMSNDELRTVAQGMRAEVQASFAESQREIGELKHRLDVEPLTLGEREKLFKRIDELKASIGESVEAALQRVLPLAFAVVRETARRFAESETLEVTANEHDRQLAGQGRDFVEIEGDKAIYYTSWMVGGNEIRWDMVHYDVQLMGGAVLHEGKVAEMSTGEGKTLVATLPVFLNALPGLGVHVVTVNDYLAKRDSEWMGPLYEFHGLSVDCIDRHEPSSDARRRAYAADITFGTNNEFGFDYLRDNMAFEVGGLVQREHNYAIVDEVDSVLIDDARTPLIISGPTNRDNNQMFEEFRPEVELLVNAQQKFVIQQLAESKRLIAEGKNEEGGKMLLRVFKGLPKYKPLTKFESEPGIKSLRLKTENFYMQENNKNMHLITDDLFFIIDEKRHSVELTDKGIDMLSRRVNDPDFFVLPDMGVKVAEIEEGDGTPDEKARAKEELMRQWSNKAERLHIVQQLLSAYTMYERDVEYLVEDNQVKIVDEQTGRTLEGRRYSDGLHQALEAKEGVKIEAPTQTFATVTLQNYFRMYRKLSGMTGTAETEAGELWSIYKLDVVVIPTNRPVIRKDGNDLLYKTVREKFAAVIEEVERLVGEGRPVLVGTTSVEISEQLSRMLKFRKIPHNVLNAKQHQREAEVVAQAGKAGTVTIATNMAGRGTDIKLSPEVRAAGGLAIIGTERHESRRVDRQLRGRSGRQGDPGSSTFFVSLEDNLMRMIVSDRFGRMMDRLGHQEGDVIQHPWFTKSVERAQRKVEENNFGIRKRLLEYDDVMNLQRTNIYTRRRHALFGERLEEDIADAIASVSYDIAGMFAGYEDYEGLNDFIMRSFAMESTISEAAYTEASGDQLGELIEEMLTARYKQRMDSIKQRAMPVLQGVVQEHGDRFENIAVPLSDGVRSIQITIPLRRAIESEGRELVRGISRTVVLHEIDDHWQQHLLAMDELKQSVQNASYEQKDPLVIFKFEGYNLFEKMIGTLNQAILEILFKIHIPVEEPEQVREAPERPNPSRGPKNLQAGRSEVATSRTSEPSRTPLRREKKIGRNDPCPCGSGKKYKQCCGRHDKQ
ncbi:MAG: preprotein translocase subunit SecA [Bacteroidia bacterium]|nr:MAG: preprotein translocase subunit SecA [Bacteroidia bacterium]